VPQKQFVKFKGYPATRQR